MTMKMSSNADCVKGDRSGIGGQNPHQPWLRPASHMGPLRQPTLIFAASFAGLLCLFPPLRTALGDDGGPVQHLHSRTVVLSGGLVADSADGAVDLGADYRVALMIDQTPVPAEIARDGDHRLAVTARVPDLADGRHTTTLTVLGPNGPVGQSRRLFVVDTSPPELAVILPAAGPINPAQRVFVAAAADDGVGLHPDPLQWRLSAEVNGVPAAARSGAGEARHLLFITASQDGWRPGQAVTVSVALQDRNGSRVATSRTYAAQPAPAAPETGTVTCTVAGGDGRPRTRQSVVPVSAVLPTRIRLSADRVRLSRGQSRQTLTIGLSTTAGQELPPGTTDGVRLVPASSQVAVARTEMSTDRVGFDIRQTAPATADTLTHLTLVYPRDLVATYDSTCDGSSARTQLTGLRPSGATGEITVPVTLEWVRTTGHRFFTLGDRVGFETMPLPAGRVQLSGSWFEAGGRSVWMTQSGDRCSAAIDAVREGPLDCRAQVTLASGVWRPAADAAIAGDGPVRLFQGRVFVRRKPPRIDGFVYDPQTQALSALVSDDGTPLAELDIDLTLGDGAELPFTLDRATGRLSAHFPMPEALVSARLAVVDLAGQSAEAICPILGVAPPAAAPQADAGLTLHTEDDLPPSAGWARWQRRRKMLRRLARLVRPAASPVQARPPAGQGPCRFSPGAVRQGQRYRRVCSPGQKVGLPADLLAPTLVGCRRDLGNPDFLNPAAVPETEKWKPDWLYRRHFHLSWCAGLLSRPISQCRCSWIDDLKPVVTILRRDGRLLHARIGDHGASLSGMTLRFTAKATFPGKTGYSGALPFTFDPDGGAFLGTLATPRSAGEHLDLRITATDRSGNTGWARTHAVLAVDPPAVALKPVRLGQWTGAGGRTVNAYLMGEAVDPGGIDGFRTRLWIDAAAVPPLIEEGGAGDDGSGPDGRQPEPYRVFFGRRLDEGRHSARIQVFDFAGLGADARIDFELGYPPRISDFRAWPAAVQAAGGPALTASIVDPGGNLHAAGIQLQIDGRIIPRERWFYDPAHGYFVLDGPLDLPSGPHTARLAALDEGGRRAEASLVFRFDQPIATAASPAGRLVLSDVGVWEIENHNGDGRANPGERIRLILALKNTDPVRVLDGVSGTLEAANTHFRIRRGDTAYGRIASGEIRVPFQGVEVDIDADIISDTGADPVLVPCVLRVASRDRAEATPLTFAVPVYRPTLPGAGPAGAGSAPGIDTPSSNAPGTGPSGGSVDIRLDPYPQTVRGTPLTLKGSVDCTGARLDWVKAWINGRPLRPYVHHGLKRFACTLDLALGENRIELRARDKQGTIGSTTARVVLSPPELPPAPLQPSVVTIALTPPPPATELDSLRLQGRVTSSGSRIHRMTGRVNGSDLAGALIWPAGGDPNRFEALVPLIPGANLIEFEASDRAGAAGAASVVVQRTVPFEPPTLTIDQPPGGRRYGCNDMVPFSGEFTTGSAALASLRAEMTGEGDASIPIALRVVPGDPGRFAADTGEGTIALPSEWGDNRITPIDISVTLTTSGGDAVTGVVRVEKYCGS
jgi:hypothetical protein